MARPRCRLRPGVVGRGAAAGTRGGAPHEPAACPGAVWERSGRRAAPGRLRLNTPVPLTPALVAASPGRAAAGLGITALLVSAALNGQHLAWWCLPLLLLAGALHFRATMHGQALPGRLARLGLALILRAGVLAGFRPLTGLAAGATLLAALTAAKLFEARAIRDWYVIVGATLFLLLAACLDRQQLWRLPLYALSLWLSVATLRSLGGGAAVSAPTLLRESARQLLYALPLAIVFFLFFPRLPGAFWSLSSDDSAITGLADQMSPGSIAELTESDEPALRARFVGELPPAHERYWRGPVLHDFDGFSWRRHHGVPASPGAVQYRGRAYHYSLTLEPNSHRTVVALELANPAGASYAQFTDDFQLISRRPLTEPQAFELSSYPQAQRGGELSGEARRIDLARPEDRNPRARWLALRLRASAADDDAVILSVLNYLRDRGVVYTLV